MEDSQHSRTQVCYGHRSRLCRSPLPIGAVEIFSVGHRYRVLCVEHTFAGVFCCSRKFYEVQRHVPGRLVYTRTLAICSQLEGLSAFLLEFSNPGYLWGDNWSDVDVIDKLRNRQDPVYRKRTVKLPVLASEYDAKYRSGVGVSLGLCGWCASAFHPLRQHLATGHYCRYKTDAVPRAYHERRYDSNRQGIGSGSEDPWRFLAANVQTRLFANGEARPLQRLDNDVYLQCEGTGHLSDVVWSEKQNDVG